MDIRPKQRTWKAALITVVLSTFGGGSAYALWMIVAIPVARADNALITTVIWSLAPLLTALGFTGGLYVSEDRLHGRDPEFRRVLIWPLAGCTAGFLILYLFGPMLIVFGMLAGGMISVALREVLLIRSNPD
jgi:hypothetical protein